MRVGKERKDEHLTRITQFIGYAEDRSSCRSSAIARYFGDNDVKDCGICDNCLRQKKAQKAASVLPGLRQQILTLLSSKSITPRELPACFTDVADAVLWMAVEQLQAEDLISTDAGGRLVLTR